MGPEELRARILADHVAIRRMLAGLEEVARRVAAGDLSFVDPLRLDGEALLRRLHDHMTWEDQHLAPALRRGRASGEEHAARLAEDHRAQREVLAYCLVSVQDLSRPVPVVARTLIDLVGMLREDIEDEEKQLVDELVRRG